MTNNSSKNVNKLSLKKIWKFFEKVCLKSTWKSWKQISFTLVVLESVIKIRNLLFTQPKLKKTTIGSNSENNPKFRQVWNKQMEH